MRRSRKHHASGHPALSRRSRHTNPDGWMEWVNENPMVAFVIGTGVVLSVGMAIAFAVVGDPFADDADVIKENFVVGDVQDLSDAQTPYSSAVQSVPEQMPQVSVAGTSAFAQAAQKYVGLEYQLGGIGQPYCEGVDCSGLIWRAARDIGVKIPPSLRRASQMYAARAQTFDEETAKKTPGALIWLMQNGKVVHVEMSMGDGRTLAAWWYGYKCGYHKWGWWKNSKKYSGAEFGQLPGIS